MDACTGQQITSIDSCQLTNTWIFDIKVAMLMVLLSYLIGLYEQSHDNQNFSGLGRRSSAFGAQDFRTECLSVCKFSVHFTFESTTFVLH